MYENAQLPTSLATMARRDLSDFERGVAKEHRGFIGCVYFSIIFYFVGVSQSPDFNPTEHL
jgi:hypothetical protein